MASGNASPINFPTEWHVIRVGPGGLITSPGVCIVGEFKRTHEWDVKKGKGVFGATVTFVGRPPARGKIKFLLWTADHFADWEAFRPILKYDPTKKLVTALPIYHPSLADIEIDSVVVENIGNIVHDGNNLYSLTVDLLEYFPPPKLSAVATPIGSLGGALANGVAGTPPPAAPDVYQQQIASLLKVAQGP